MTPNTDVPNTEHAWAAGFLDGEGCIRIAKRDPGNGANFIYSLEVTLTQNCLETLQHFKDVMGIQASIYIFPCKGPIRAPVYGLTYRCTRARELLERVLSYLVRKRCEAEVGIEFACRASFARQGRRRHSTDEIAIREGYYQRLRALKLRGPRQERGAKEGLQTPSVKADKMTAAA